MRGRHALVVRSAHLRYEMAFSRNITVIQGDSATGKTTLVDMVREYLLMGSDTGITLECDCPCQVIGGNTWQRQLSGVEDSVVFIDEGNRFVSSVDFARVVRGSSNYYVVITREALDNLPYSVTEVYGIRSSGKYNSLEPVYHEMYRIYGERPEVPVSSGVLLTEDSNSGYDFFSSIAKGEHVRCLSAGGAANVFARLENISEDEAIVVVADGAAFGSQVGRVWRLAERRRNICLYLPESFEWLILSSGVIDDGEVRDMLLRPYDYVDSAEFMSWERYFTHVLTVKSQDTWLRYSKSSLNPVYLQGRVLERIVKVLPSDIRGLLQA